ncbi:MAG TPA: hypothetical protein VGP72_21315 [Planctomycetota bacterium]
MATVSPAAVRSTAPTGRRAIAAAGVKASGTVCDYVALEAGRRESGVDAVELGVQRGAGAKISAIESSAANVRVWIEADRHLGGDALEGAEAEHALLAGDVAAGEHARIPLAVGDRERVAAAEAPHQHAVGAVTEHRPQLGAQQVSPLRLAQLFPFSGLGAEHLAFQDVGAPARGDADELINGIRHERAIAPGSGVNVDAHCVHRPAVCLEVGAADRVPIVGRAVEVGGADQFRTHALDKTGLPAHEVGDLEYLKAAPVHPGRDLASGGLARRDDFGEGGETAAPPPVQFGDVGVLGRQPGAEGGDVRSAIVEDPIL